MQNLKQPKIAVIAESMLIGYGVGEVVNLLAERLSRNGFNITVLTNKNEYSCSNYKTVTYKVAALPRMSEFWNDNFLIDLRSFFSLVSVLNEYDVIITVDPMHIVGALSYGIFRKKVIMYYFGVPPQKILDSFVRKVESVRQNLLWNLSFHFSDRVLTNSYYTRNLLSPLIRGRAIVNYHGIDHLVCHEKEKAVRLRKDLAVGDRKLILSVGRFSTPYKGMIQTMKLFNKLQKNQGDCVLLLIGRGSISDLEVQSPPDNVVVLTKVPLEKLRVCFEACDLYCTCSRWEGFDLPIVAAQANGKPVIAYRVGAHEEVVTDGETGFLVDTPTEFLSRLSLLTSDDELRRKMGEKARIAMRKFNWGESVRNFQNTICQVFAES